jgi:hypothetical protein
VTTTTAQLARSRDRQRDRTFPLSTADWGRGMLQPRSSEHHELDVLPGENRACRDECVAADDEVLREGLDVA